MRQIVFYLLLFASSLSFVSCSNTGTYPEKIFGTIGLNSNKIPSNFKRAFDEIRGQKRVGNLKIYSEAEKKFIPATAQEYVTVNYQNLFEEDIRKIQALVGDDESQPIIEAGLALFVYADEIYKTDYPKMAQMIEEGVSDEEINRAIAQLEATKGIELEKLRIKTMDLLLPYADKKGVDYKTMERRF